jgi:hypothetical protein
VSCHRTSVIQRYEEKEESLLLEQIFCDLTYSLKSRKAGETLLQTLYIYYHK